MARKENTTRRTRALPPAFNRPIGINDLGIDVFPVSPGKRFFVPEACWVQNNPEPAIATTGPLTMHAACLLSVSNSIMRVNDWEFKIKPGKKQRHPGGELVQSLDVLAYRPGDGKAGKAVIAGVITYDELLANRAVTSRDVLAQSQIPGIFGTVDAFELSTVIECFRTQIERGVFEGDKTYTNTNVQRIVRESAKKLGGKKIGSNRYFVPHYPNLGDQSPAVRFANIASAVEQTFPGYTVFTSPVAPTFSSARAMLGSVVEEIAKEVNESLEEITKHVEDTREGVRQRDQRKWRADRREQLEGQLSELNATVDRVAEIYASARDGLDSETEGAFLSLLAWAKNETLKVDTEVESGKHSLVTCDPLNGTAPQAPFELHEEMSNDEVTAAMLEFEANSLGIGYEGPEGREGYLAPRIPIEEPGTPLADIPEFVDEDTMLADLAPEPEAEPEPEAGPVDVVIPEDDFELPGYLDF